MDVRETNGPGWFVWAWIAALVIGVLTGGILGYVKADVNAMHRAHAERAAETERLCEVELSELRALTRGR